MRPIANYERIIECAREAFAEHGTDAPPRRHRLARRVGPDTLYRHFPHRTALMEAVYRANIESLATTLKAAIDRSSETFAACSGLLAEAAGSVLGPVQEAGIVRPEVSPRDILRLGHGIGAGCQAAADSAPLLTEIALAGLRVPPRAGA
ncbi:TetR/AcrR family transcriptional regulator [Nocardia asteroides]|uniref:TetR/AcrR family transcriptional regulator n=1 Tax=Nocardia asteroides TaxID=1824 RepID=UPI0037C589EA